ncbi:hypothetical protein [Fervidibacter sacchari]
MFFQRNRFRRTRFLVLTLLAIGCLAGCIARSPVKRALKEADAWQQVAKQLSLTDHSNLDTALNKILRPVKNSREATSLRLLAQRLDDDRESKDWLVGRALLCAGVAYLKAANIALVEGKLSEAKRFCLAASENFAVAAKRLPSWERESVKLWAEQLKVVVAKLDAEQFYAMTHLKALLEKAKAHAKFVPPIRQGENR